MPQAPFINPRGTVGTPQMELKQKKTRAPTHKCTALRTFLKREACLLAPHSLLCLASHLTTTKTRELAEAGSLHQLGIQLLRAPGNPGIHQPPPGQLQPHILLVAWPGLTQLPRYDAANLNLSFPTCLLVQDSPPEYEWCYKKEECAEETWKAEFAVG